MSQPPATPSPPEPPPPNVGSVAAPAPGRSLTLRLADTFDLSRMFFGPVFQRDMRVLGRKTGTYWARGLYALTLGAFVSMVFMAMASTVEWEQGVARVQRFQGLAPGLAIAIGWFQLLTSMLIGPVLTAPAICDEKRNRTMSALATSPLTATQIICSSLASRVVQMVILLLMSAPLLLALRVFGGLDADMVLGISSLSVTAGVLGAALGLWGSVHGKRPASGAAFAVFWMAFLCLLPVVVMLVNVALSPRQARPSFIGLEPAVAMSPAFSLLLLTVPSGFPIGVSFGSIWLVNSISNLILTGVVCLIASAQLRRVLIREAAETPATVHGPVTAKPGSAQDKSGDSSAAPHPHPVGFLIRLRRAFLARVMVFALGLLVPGAYFVLEALYVDEPRPWPLIASALCAVLSVAFLMPTRRPARVVSDAPVTWREVRQSPFGGPLLNLIIALAVAAMLAFAYSQGGVHESEFGVFLTVVCALIAMLQACASAGGSIAAEVQSRTWHVLLTTPLSPGEIIRGKILGVLYRAWPMPALWLFHQVIVFVRGELHPMGIAMMATTLLSGVTFLASLGVALSLYFRKQTPATVWTVIVAVGLWLVLPGSVALFAAIAGGGFLQGPGEKLMDLLLSFNPIWMACIALEANSRRSWFGEFNMPSGRMRTDEFLFFEAIGCAVLLVAAFLAYRWAVKTFTRLNARTG